MIDLIIHVNKLKVKLLSVYFKLPVYHVSYTNVTINCIIEIKTRKHNRTHTKYLTETFEMRVTCRIHQFQKKSDAFCATIVYDTNDLPPKFQYCGLGYQSPNGKLTEKLSGLDSYPAIFTYPEVS